MDSFSNFVRVIAMRAYSHFFACFLVFAFLMAGCAQRQEQIKARAQLHLQIGSSHLAQGNYPAALAELLKAEELDPKNPIIQNNLGIAYGVRGRNKEAEDHYLHALAIDPGYADARSNYARLQIDQKKYADALKNLAIVENDLTYPAPEKILSLMGMAYFYQSRYKQAEDYLSRAMNARRESCVTSNFYGRTLFEEHKLDDAAGILDLAIENCRQSKFEEPLFFSAMTYYSLGEKEKSKARIDELLKNYPRSAYLTKAKGLLNLLE
jgi:Tfp pilus assembly protein PilF